MIALPLPSITQLALTTALIALIPQPLRAADPRPTVTVSRTATCATPREDKALRRALDIELAAMHVDQQWESADPPEVPSARISLASDCAADGTITVRVWTSRPRLVIDRAIPLRDVPAAARARTLALIISEALGPALAAEAAEAAEAPQRPDRRLAARDPDTTSTASDAHLAEPLFTSVDPYAPWGALFTSEDPYATARPIRLAATAHARIMPHGGSPQLALELGLSGPLSNTIDWAAEASYSGATTWTSDEDRDFRWWSAAIGADLISASDYSLALGTRFALGPRFALGHITVVDSDDDFFPREERTLMTSLGARARVEIPLSARASLQTMVLAQHSLGVLALTRYTGLDRIARGWLLSWGIGLAFDL